MYNVDPLGQVAFCVQCRTGVGELSQRDRELACAEIDAAVSKHHDRMSPPCVEHGHQYRQ